MNSSTSVGVCIIEHKVTPGYTRNFNYRKVVILENFGRKLTRKERHADAK